MTDVVAARAVAVVAKRLVVVAKSFVVVALARMAVSLVVEASVVLAAPGRTTMWLGGMAKQIGIESLDSPRSGLERSV